MDFHALQLAYHSLPPLAQQACDKVGTAVFTKVLGGALGALTPKAPAAFAGIYRQWLDGVESEADSEKRAAAFEDFFKRPPTLKELEKLLRDQYADVSFPVLEQQLRESCEWAGCPMPSTGLYPQLDLWARDLQALLEDSPQYREKYQVSLRNAIRELGHSEALIRNYSLARERYLASVVHQHRHVRFSGMADVSGPTEVEMARIFVMPRVLEKREFGARGAREPKPVEAYKLLTAKKPPRRVVILGGPGTGKTTLLESLCLAFAQGAQAPFPWARNLPPLLPIFYRIRDLDRDLDKCATIWDSIGNECSLQWV